MGYVAAMAATEWGCAVQLMAAVSIGSGLSFTPSTGQLLWVSQLAKLFHTHIYPSAVFIAVFLVTALTASLASKTIARMQTVYSLLNIL